MPIIIILKEGISKKKINTNYQLIEQAAAAFEKFSIEHISEPFYPICQGKDKNKRFGAKSGAIGVRIPNLLCLIDKHRFSIHKLEEALQSARLK